MDTSIVKRLSELRKTGETADKLMGGSVLVLQKEKGYRFSIDAILLAHFVNLAGHDCVCDLGTGSAVIPIILSKGNDRIKIAGVEIQDDLADMAMRNVRLNDLEHSVRIYKGDIKKIGDYFDPESFHCVFFNPPYRKVNSGRINPDREKAVARHEIEGTVADFLSAARYLLSEGGSVHVIYPATRLVELISGMRKMALEPKRIRMVHSNNCSRAQFILAEGIKGGGEELHVMPPLSIYNDDGVYSGEMEEIFREINHPRSFSG
ncbi:MAG: tRNA1(Val) (adenine(37)-N6)-methyltransferase [Deltaproteobacteria bacterium]|nr:tRNA1(Val) (adenine(37)-N6)-methyltransferase [Deltaproteobacteria bacterium]